MSKFCVDRGLLRAHVAFTDSYRKRKNTNFCTSVLGVEEVVPIKSKETHNLKGWRNKVLSTFLTGI